MKRIGLEIAAGIIFLSQLLNAQTVAPDSIVQITAEASGLSQVPPDQVPPFGTFWLMSSNGLCPAPLPCPPTGDHPIYQISDDQFLVDDTAGETVSESVLTAQADAVVNLINQISDAQLARPMMMAMAAGVPSPGEGGGSGDYAGFTNSYSTFSFDTNLLWLEITNIFNGTAFVNLHHATNQVYAIWATTDLNIPFSLWPVETELFPNASTTNLLPFTVAMFGRQNLFLRAQDWKVADSNGDGVPDWWMWYYFHTLTLNATNSDGQGATIGYDYTNHHDPNVINFAIEATNLYVNSANPVLSLDILSGFPGYAAILVNDANYSHATWQPYDGNGVLAGLGADGNYSVYVGLRGFATNATASWQTIDFTKDTIAPLLTFTAPVDGMATQTPTQVFGFANEPLGAVTFDLTNAAGLLTNQTGFLIGQVFDSNQQIFTTNFFQSDDLDLVNGSNLITIHASDWAGNKTNLSISLNYSAGTNPPSVNIVWPVSGTSVAGSTLTVQAQLDSATTTISASTGGTTVQGVVERNGTAWIRNVPLSIGANTITLMATDLNGHSTVSYLNVVRNDVGLVISALSNDQLNQPLVNVSGKIGDASLQVYVNGVAASINSVDGTWQASSVPVSPSGTAILDTEVYSGGSTPIASQILYQPQPVMVSLMSYSGHQAELAGGLTYYGEINWFYNTGGNMNDGGILAEISPATNGIAYVHSTFSDPFPLTTPWEFASVSTPVPNYMDLYQSYTSTRVMINPTGQAQAGQTNLYLVLANAREFSNIRGATYFDLIYNVDYAGDVLLPPQWLQVRGQTLVNTGRTNILSSISDDVWGATIVSGQAGKNLDVTPVATRVYHNWNYTFDVKAYQVGLKILDANNGQNLTGQTNTVIVGQQMNLICQLSITNSFMTNFVLTNFSWTVPGFALTNWYESGGPYYEGQLYPTNGHAIPLTATNSQSIQFFWTDGAANIADASNLVVTCTATVAGMPIVAQATFKVVKPIVKISAETSVLTLGIDQQNRYGLCFGTNSGPPGILFNATYTLPPGTNYNYGDQTSPGFKYVQIISTFHNDFYFSFGSPLLLNLTNTSILDSVDPYNYFGWPRGYPNTSDSPTSPVDWGTTITGVIYEFKATMWLLFKPHNGQWSPVRTVTWGFNGSATNSGTGWNLTSATWTTNPPDADAGATYPYWTNNIATWGIHP